MKKLQVANLATYVRDDSIVTNAGHVAHFLNWAATNYPGEYFPPARILQGIMGYKRTPKSNSADIESIRRSLQLAQKYLFEKYNRGLVVSNGIGYRATYNSEDAVATTVKAKARRLNGAKNQLRRALDIVNPKEISSTETGKQLKAYYYNLKDTTQSLFSAEFEKRLLPPQEETKDAPTA